MASRSQYPPYQPAGGESQASFDHAYHDSTANLHGSEKGAAGLAAGGFKGTSGSKMKGNKRTWTIVGVVLAILVITGAVVGGVLGSKAARDTEAGSSTRDAAVKVVAVGTTTESNGKVETLSSTTTSSASRTSSSTAAARPSVSALPEWKWTQSAYAAAQSSGNGEPMYGAALGNWLVLEAWMDQPWFNASASNDASVLDEWSLMQKLGDNAQSVMTEHYETWVTESDIEQLHQAGMNHIRIPVGFWAFIDCANGEPYLCNFNQTAYVDRVLGWAHSRGMYAILDIHALPGSQNGEVTSGHLTRNPTFFQDANQQRSKDTVKAALAYITNSPYRSVISALQVINEPRPYTTGQFDMLRDYFQDAYDQSMALSSPVPIIFHHGYPDQVLNTPYTTYWQSFATGKDPNYLAMSTHPYIGTFPLSNDASYMLNAVCNTTTRIADFPVPVLVTEWSIQTGIKTTDFERQLFTSELVNFAMVGGSIFWNFKAVNGNVNNGDNSQWSFLDLLGKGSVPTPSNGQSMMQWMESLGQPCGSMTRVSWAASSSSSQKKARRARHISPK